MKNQDLYKFLVKLDVLEESEIKRLYQEAESTNKSLEDLIFSENIFSEDESVKIKSMLSGIPKADLHKKTVSPKALSNIDESISREYGAVCFLENEDGLHIACYSPDILDKLSGHLPKDKKSNFYIDSANNIKNVLSDYQDVISEDFGFRISNLSKKLKKVSDYGTENFVKFFPDDYLMEISDDIYTRRIIDLILEDSLIKNCDSVSIIGEDSKTKINYRVGSKTLTSANLDGDIIYPIVLNLKRQADLNLSEEKTSEDGYFVAKINKKEIFVIFNILKTISGYRVNLNISKGSEEITDVIESMVQSPTQLENIYKKLSEERGLIVLSGDSKSGKTRTFYNLLKMLQKKSLDIFTIEKRPEMDLFGISQISVSPKERSFSKYIEKSSIQNPDVLGLSEIYKNDLVKILNQVSVGKLVISEYRKGFISLFNELKKLKFSNETLDRIVSASISHKTFPSYLKMEKINLTKKEISVITKIIPEDEVIELLRTSRSIDKKINKLGDVEFYTKSKRSKKGKGDIYVRGVIDVKETVSFDKDTGKTIEEKIKRAICENALILSARGVVNIKDVLKFIK